MVSRALASLHIHVTITVYISITPGSFLECQFFFVVSQLHLPVPRHHFLLILSLGIYFPYIQFCINEAI